MDLDKLRADVHSRFRKRRTRGAQRFGEMIQEKPRCWGDMVSVFHDVAKSDEARLDIFDGLVELGEWRPLALFLDAVRSQPSVLRVVAGRAAELPMEAQKAFVSLPEAAALWEQLPADIHPAAAALVSGSEDQREREREVVLGQVRKLQSHRVPKEGAPERNAPDDSWWTDILADLGSGRRRSIGGTNDGDS